MRSVHGVVEHLQELHSERQHLVVVACLLLGVDLAAELLYAAELGLSLKDEFQFGPPRVYTVAILLVR